MNLDDQICLQPLYVASSCQQEQSPPIVCASTAKDQIGTAMELGRRKYVVIDDHYYNYCCRRDHAKKNTSSCKDNSQLIACQYEDRQLDFVRKHMGQLQLGVKNCDEQEEDQHRYPAFAGQQPPGDNLSCSKGGYSEKRATSTAEQQQEYQSTIIQHGCCCEKRKIEATYRLRMSAWSYSICDYIGASRYIVAVAFNYLDRYLIVGKYSW